MVAFMTAAQQLNMLMLDMAADRKEHPNHDVVSALVNTNVDGEALTDTEIVACLDPAGRGGQRDYLQRHQPRARR